MTRLLLDDVSAAYGASRVLHNLTLAVEDGELLALLGPSGCGKTTALKLIAGLASPDQGDILFDEGSVRDLPAERRGAVMVFQKPLLFPHLTVAENVAFGLRMRRLPRDEIGRRVAEALQMVQLPDYGSRRPPQLSGGQEQRVTLARALVTEPRLLLLDEPFSALDEGLRSEMRDLVRGLQRRLRITTVFVTHDQAEAASIADRIALLLDGRLEQHGPARDFYTAPRTARAARFFGWQLIAGRRRGSLFETPAGEIRAPAGFDSAEAWIAFRPESVILASDGERSGSALEAVVQSSLDLGTRTRYRVALGDGAQIEIDDARRDEIEREAHQPGARVRLLLPDARIRFFDR
jgi:ABC-type Fe3+/spermidine/putrescine transport system ATPase subunit